MNSAKTEEDLYVHIKEENVNDGHSWETQNETDGERERGLKECSEKKNRETDDHNMGDGSKEVRQNKNINKTLWRFNHNAAQTVSRRKILVSGRCFFIFNLVLMKYLTS